MRDARINDIWSRIRSFKKFSNVLSKIEIEDSGRFKQSSVIIESAVTSICGKNGLGKTTLLKIFYKSLSKNPDFTVPNIPDDEVNLVRFEIKRNGNVIGVSSDDDKILPNVEYFDGAVLLHKIISEITSSPQKNGWMNEATKVEVSEQDILIVKMITGKKYDVFNVFEVGNIIEDTTFPHFEVGVDGYHYSNEGMGQGEHKLLLLWWKMFTAKANSFMLLEEPEAHVCPFSQTKSMDMIAYYASEKKINVILTTHSEHILSKLNVNSINILKRKSRNKYCIIPASNHSRYLSALGLSSEFSQILFVEDEFAKLFLQLILKRFDEYSYKTSLIQVLNGESNIKMLTKHYEGACHFNYVAVYDADQRGVEDGFEPYICKVYLPSVSNVAPEIDVINCVTNNIKEYSERINFNEEDLDAEVSSLVCNHHDWFRYLSKNIDKSLDLLKVEAIELWINKNETLSKNFVFELNNVKNEVSVKVSGDEVTKYIVTSCGLKYDHDGHLVSHSNIGSELKGRLVYDRGYSKIKVY